MLARKGKTQQQSRWAKTGKKFLAKKSCYTCMEISRLKPCIKVAIVRDLLRAMAFLSQPPHQAHPRGKRPYTNTFKEKFWPLTLGGYLSMTWQIL